MTAEPTHAVEVFYCYDHADEGLRNELEKHLSLLKRQGQISAWHDREIGAGKEWDQEIDAHLNTAQIVLLLVSPDFLASDYCYDVEVKRAIARHEAGEARVIPVILRPVDWKDAPFGKLQPLPASGIPVTSWSDLDAAFLDVVQGIRKAVADLLSSSPIISAELQREQEKNVQAALLSQHTSSIRGKTAGSDRPATAFLSYKREVHLFASLPAALAVMVGHQFNALGAITLYHYVQIDEQYIRVCTLGKQRR